MLKKLINMILTFN